LKIFYFRNHSNFCDFHSRFKKCKSFIDWILKKSDCLQVCLNWKTENKVMQWVVINNRNLKDVKNVTLNIMISLISSRETKSFLHFFISNLTFWSHSFSHNTLVFMSCIECKIFDWRNARTEHTIVTIGWQRLLFR
jgi:hypothetical protein